MKNRQRISLLSALICCLPVLACARFGGAGGHGSHSSHSSHSGGGFGHSGIGYGSGGGGGDISLGGIIVIIVLVVVGLYIWSKVKGSLAGSGMQDMMGDNNETSAYNATPFPEGLTKEKVLQAFMDLQTAWQRKDLKGVRRWISDGMYQRLAAQFKMMEALGQSNRLSGISMHDIRVDRVSSDGPYDTAEVALTFSMDDQFTSTKYPQFNEDYPADTDTEYWTFIRRKDAQPGKNLYDNAACPNCGAPFEQKMGEIARCASCGTLTNSAAYDWVLSEVTQDEDYSGGAGLPGDAGLRSLLAGDPLFAVQRAEDIASNVAMQILRVMTGDSNKRLDRFASRDVAMQIATQKSETPPFVFDRLYLNKMTLAGYDVSVDRIVHLYFDASATFRRVTLAGGIRFVDSDFAEHSFSMTLSRKAAPAGTTTGAKSETVYSFECSSCGAPFTDTTEANCSYCDAPVVDMSRDWVLTAWGW